MKPHKVLLTLEIEVDSIDEQEAQAMVEENVTIYISDLPDFNDVKVVDIQASSLREDNIPPEVDPEEEN